MYHSLADEVNTHDFIRKWYASKRILLPVVKGEWLELYTYNGPDRMKIGAYGIEEPTEGKFTDLMQIDLAVIPGVALCAVATASDAGKGITTACFPSWLPRTNWVSAFPTNYWKTFLPNLSTYVWTKCSAEHQPDGKRLSENNVGDDLSPDMLVQVTHKQLAPHHQLLTQGSRCERNVQHLIFDEKVTRIGSDDRPQHFGPRIDEPAFVQRRLQTLLPQEITYQHSYLFGIVSFHTSPSCISVTAPCSTRNIR